MSCCSSCSHGGPCAGSTRPMAAGSQQNCPECGHRDHGTDMCPRCGFDWAFWDSLAAKSASTPLHTYSSSWKGGVVPPREADPSLYPRKIVRYPPASLLGPEVRRYPRNAYLPRLPYQRKLLAKYQHDCPACTQGTVRSASDAGMSKRDFGMARKMGYIR